MKNYKAKDVDGFITSAPKEARATLKGIRAVIRAAVPKAEEGISWGIPFYRYHGMLAGFTAVKDHAIFGLAFALLPEDREKLLKKGYVTGKKTVRIGFGQKVPASAIRRMLKAKAKANEAEKRRP